MIKLGVVGWVVCGAVLVRVVVAVGYWPGFFSADSVEYLRQAAAWEPGVIRPFGYSLMLGVVPWVGLVVVLQHLMGVAGGVLVHALLRRAGLPVWGSLLAAAPVLFDVRQVQVEHAVLSDTLLQFCLLGAVGLVMWRVSGAMLYLVAGLLSLAVLVRPVAAPVVALVVGVLVVRRVSWRVVAGFVAVVAVPVLVYAGWFQQAHGRFGVTSSDGLFLWARTMTFADCARIAPPPELRPLCPEEEDARRHAAEGFLGDGKLPGEYLWDRGGWPWSGGTAFTAANNAAGRAFAVRAIAAQPVDYALVVGRDVALTLLLSDPVFARPGSGPFAAVPVTAGAPRTQVVAPVPDLMRVYQQVAFPGVGYLLALVAGLVGIVRRRGGPAVLPWAASVGLLVLACALAQAEYRYALPGMPLACLAAGLAFVRAPVLRLVSPPREPIDTMSHLIRR